MRGARDAAAGKMILDEIRQLSTGRRDLRKFGLLVGLVFALLAAWTWWRGGSASPYLLAMAIPLLVAGIAYPPALKWPYVGWMSMALVLGWVVSTILLTLFFYLVVTPVGLLARVLGRDFLDRRFDKGAGSYWRDRPNPPTEERTRYERQF
jgi:hypothetical protein